MHDFKFPCSFTIPSRRIRFKPQFLPRDTSFPDEKTGREKQARGCVCPSKAGFFFKCLLGPLLDWCIRSFTVMWIFTFSRSTKQNFIMRACSLNCFQYCMRCRSLMKLSENGIFYAVRPQRWDGLICDLTFVLWHKKNTSIKKFFSSCSCFAFDAVKGTSAEEKKCFTSSAWPIRDSHNIKESHLPEKLVEWLWIYYVYLTFIPDS